MQAIPSQRHLFEIPDDVTYLNCAYMSPQLRSVTEAGILGVRRKSTPWEVTAPDFFDEVETARSLFARLIEGDAEGVAVIPAASYGVATAATNLPIHDGGRVVVLDEQFPSDLYSWRTAAERAGAEVVTVSRPPTGDWTQATVSAIDQRTNIISVPNAHWTDGGALDLRVVGAAAREVGAALVVDATQSLGAVPLSVREVRPDFLIAAAYKWLLGPYSMGFMWVAPEWRDGRPLEESWMTRRGSNDFARLVDYRDEFRDGARRFDVGEASNFALMPAAIAALEQILDWGVERIAMSLRTITDQIAEEAVALGLTAPQRSSRSPHMIGLGMPGGFPSDLPERLAANRVYVSVRADSIRVSPHLYNDHDDVKRLIEQLATVSG